MGDRGNEIEEKQSEKKETEGMNTKITTKFAGNEIEDQNSHD